MTLDDVLDRFDGVTRRGDDAMARCPHHPDRTASLSISQGRDAVVLCCQAGCNTGDVLGAVGLKFSDLTDKPKSNGNGAAKRRQVADYDYVDEQGNLLYQVVRYEPKDFRQRRPDGAGWTWKLGDTRRVLYNLPDVVDAVAADVEVWVVEGEKDADALGRAGQVATCNVGGAGKWRKEYADALKGARVVICADNDGAGIEHARRVAASLDGVAAQVRVVRPRRFKDIADHLGAGLELDDLEPIDCQGADALADDAVNDAPTSTALRLLLSVRSTAQMQAMPPAEWVIGNWIPRHALSVMWGPPGSMKSFLALSIAAAVATGTEWYGNETRRGLVLYQAGEGGAGIGARTRAWQTAAGVDDDELSPLLWIPTGVNLLDPERRDAFVYVVAEHKPELVIVDTCARALPGGDENVSRDMGRVVEFSDMIRDACGAGCLVVHHGTREGKNMRGHSSLDGAADAVLEVSRDGRIVTLKNTKAKDAEEAAPMQFEPCPVGVSIVLNSLPNGRGSERSSLDAVKACWRQLGSNESFTSKKIIELSNIAERTGYRVINALVEEGFVDKEGTPDRPRYRLRVRGIA